MVEDTAGCVQPAAGPLIESVESSETEESQKSSKEVAKVLAKVGQPAPDFEAGAYIDGKIKNLKLSDYRGKWVVLCFYPGDFTFVCPTELTAVARKYSELQGMNVEVLSMSTDSPFSHLIWQEGELSKMVDGGVPFPMLTDAGGRIGAVYGVYEEAGGVDIRGRFLIDPEGVIVAMEVMNADVGRNVNELIRQIQGFQHVAATGEVTPAGWTPGKPTLKPGPDLAGKVWTVWKPE